MHMYGDVRKSVENRVYLYTLWSHWPRRSRRTLNTKRDPGGDLTLTEEIHF